MGLIIVCIIQIEMKASICEALYTYDALQKRKPYLDQIMEGLEDFQLATCMKMFPATFEPLFVNCGRCQPSDVISILHHKPDLSGPEIAVFDHLKRFLTQCSTTGMMIISV